jgi:hypothetical protein
MANQKMLACLLIATGLVLLALVNQLGWLLVMIPAASLIACSLAGSTRAKRHGARI